MGAPVDRPDRHAVAPPQAGGRVRRRLRVEGVVQGVGFRPFVYALAAEHGLAGFVGNDAAGVCCEVEGPAHAVDAFTRALASRPPSLAVVERVVEEPTNPTGAAGFTIVTSDVLGSPTARVSPDVATCDACLAEVLDPAARRYRYAFTNCTHCGPRFTIVTGIPYDRARTTMAPFAMCAACAAEYADPADRRFHAQPVCCPACGPRLTLVAATGTAVPGDPVEAAAARLRDGQVLAVKGLGGYHLAALASSDAAVARLRARKHREDKPFAVLAPSLEAACALVEVDAAGEALLLDRRRPVVLLPRRAGAPVARAVAPGNRWLGVMLPYTPLHHLLARDLGQPCVLTSGNVSDEPIAYDDDDAYTRLARIADAWLTHDRPIRTRTDDSVVRVVTGRPMPVRRSRGYVPDPVTLPCPADVPVLAVGAELKNTFTLARGGRAFVSHHIGDLENYETLRSFTDGVGHLSGLLETTPAVLAHDLHPEYLSTKYARERAETEGLPLVGVQHHHAHVASVLADAGETGPVLGVAYDGLGYGTDGTFWGGELLVADLAGFTREGHLEPVPMPGGASAIRQPWRMAASWLDAAYAGEAPGLLGVLTRHAGRWDDVLALARAGTASPRTTSVGRLFDAVAAVVGLRDEVTYEGQAAIALEQAVDPTERGAYPVRVEPGPPVLLRAGDLVRAAAEDVRRGVDAGIVAGRFHRGLVDATVDALILLRERTGLDSVALSGGVFQNAVLVTLLVPALEASGLRVLLPRQVPVNDGGISLGQAAVAACRTAPGRAR
ncbi:MAG: carbamoyltransferase HypF [Actinomycetes bacterium]